VRLCQPGCSDRQEQEGKRLPAHPQTHSYARRSSLRRVRASGWNPFSEGRGSRAAGPWRGAISLRSGTGRAIGSPARAVTGHGGEHEGRERRDTDGDAGAGTVPRPPAGRGTPGVRGRASVARGAQAWVVSRPPAHLSMPHAKRCVLRAPRKSLAALAFESLPVAVSIRTAASTRSLS
jgi:hypothetical protein